MHDFEVRKLSHSATGIWMDGKQLQGVYRIETEHAVNSIPMVTITFYAGKLNIVDEGSECSPS